MIATAALRFLYSVTLHKDWRMEAVLQIPRKPQTLPIVLSPEEVLHFLKCVAVYRELLKTYKANNIGIYGCSAGGLLTAEAVAWLQKEKLPTPGAIGMFCAGAGYWTEGDSGYIGKAQYGGIVWGTMRDNPYFRNTDPNNPLAFPVRSHTLMGKFPPSILIAATRDPALSSVVHTHSVLISLGVDAELHVWEGLGHAFFLDPDFPQSREVYAITVKFFDTHLGK